jgi:ankyrin repeat protein
MSANALGNAAGEGCVESEVDTAALIKTIDVLVRRGIDINPNQGNNGFLFDAARYCPVVVVQKLIDIGVKVERNPGGFSPLQVALASGKWDVATLLVDHGARLNKKEVDEIFFEKPTDPKQLALLKRAAGK